MAPSEWNHVLELFHAALETSPEARTVLLDQACGTETAIRKAVEDLLREHDSAGSFLSHPVWDAAQTAAGAELFAPESRFECFVLKKVLGRGGMGEVWSARDLELDRPVALKFLRAHTSLEMDAVQIVREAQAASALNHPNIVTIHGVVRSEGIAAIVMELVEGSSLATLRKTPVAVENVLAIGSQIAQALAAAHAHGIVHGDIKPENIVQRQDGYIKVLDFGLAHRVIAEGMSAARLPGFGTLRYMSPEQANGESLTPASDIFSFGLVLFELAAGRHPFSDQSSDEALQSNLTRTPPAPSSVNPRIVPALNSLILAMLAKDPSARPPAAGVVRRLEQIAGESTRRSLRRRAWMAGSLLAVAAGSLLVTSLWTHAHSPMALRLDAKPLTGEEGRETNPALSPDGRFVIYSWQSTAASPPVTLLREIGSDRKTVLPISPLFSWLPDNQHIGFIRRGKKQDVLCTIATDGSGEQEILRARNLGYARWSPDGDWIVYTGAAEKNEQMHALFLYSTRTRETRQLTVPPDTSPGDEWFVISPDGKHVAFRRVFDFLSSDIFVIGLPVPGPPRQVTFQRVAGNDLAWIGDGKAIVYSMLSGSTFSLWLHPLDSAQAPSRLTEVGLEVTGVQRAMKRNRLAWVSALDDSNIWSVPLSGGTPRRVISSAMRDLDIASSTLGLLAFRSDRSGAPEIWISRENGESQKKVTNLNGRSGSPRWSPDGQRLVFDSRRGKEGGIYLMDCDASQLQCGPPVQLTDRPGTDAIPNWSADGSSVYFASLRTGQWQVWRVSANGNHQEPTQMTTKGGFFAAESADRKWLYYSRTDSDQVLGVWRKPLPGNSTLPFRVDDAGEMLLPLEYRATATWVLAGHEIIYSTAGDMGTSAALWAFDFETRRKRMIHTTGDVPLARGLALSPERTSVLFSQLDRWQSNIVVADYEIVK